MKKVLVSGGFDPIHIGHIKLFKEAKALGDYLIVLANNDNWLKAKKGFVFMNQDERKAVIEAIRWVDEVQITKHPENPTDMSICAELKEIKPDIFANGGDRNKADADTASSSLNPEQKLCSELGIEMAFNVGGEKLQSSSDLVKRAKEAAKK
jgi:D-beta-D-heptose 7-phosphate kinase/D-beta-D-heptose 1-phosphate adenosyltransferase